MWNKYGNRKVTNDEGIDSDEVSGAFTTSGVGLGGTGGDMTRVGDDWIHYFRVGFDDREIDAQRFEDFSPSRARACKNNFHLNGKYCPEYRNISQHHPQFFFS